MSKARVLLYDIETAPNLAYTWTKYLDGSVIDFEREWYMLCFAYKWLGERKTHIVALPDFPLYQKDPENDVKLLEKLHELFDEADVVIAHNGNSFDQKKVHARFIFHGMEPPSPYLQIDTKLVARRYFNFNSNKLDDLGEHLGEGKKVETGGFKLWRECMEGKESAWNKMKRYNAQDVRLLEKIYLRMRPWIAGHPPINVIEDMPDGCPKCGEQGTLTAQGTRKTTNQSVYQRYKCMNCAGWSRGRKAIPVKDYIHFVN